MTIENIAKPAKIAKDGRVMSPVSLANLNPPYKKGENGHGRVYPLKLRLQHALDHPLEEPTKDAKVGERLVYETLRGALDLVPVAFHETWDRVEGKVPDHTIPLGAPITNNFLFVLPDGTKVSPRALIEGANRERLESDKEVKV